jgi:hypothetical protein
MQVATPPNVAAHRRPRSEHDPQDDADQSMDSRTSPTGSVSWRESTRWNDHGLDRTAPLAFGALAPQDGYDSHGSHHPLPGTYLS